MQSHSGGAEENTLPGLTQLAQQWMGDVLAPRFRDVDPSPANFDQWYRNSRVMLYLQVPPPHPLSTPFAHTQNNGKTGSAGCTSSTKNCWLVVLEALQGEFQPGPSQMAKLCAMLERSNTLLCIQIVNPQFAT